MRKHFCDECGKPAMPPKLYGTLPSGKEITVRFYNNTTEVIGGEGFTVGITFPEVDLCPACLAQFAESVISEETSPLLRDNPPAVVGYVAEGPECERCAAGDYNHTHGLGD